MATMFRKYCGSRALEKHSSLCAKLILNRDQLVKYLGFPLHELEIIYPFCAKGGRIFRRYTVYQIIILILYINYNNQL